MTEKTRLYHPRCVTVVCFETQVSFHLSSQFSDSNLTENVLSNETEYCYFKSENLKDCSATLDATCWWDWELHLPDYNVSTLLNVVCVQEKHEWQVASDLWYKSFSGDALLINALFKDPCPSCSVMTASANNRHRGFIFVPVLVHVSLNILQ